MQELIERARCGDKEAFTDIVLSIEKDLYRIAKTRLHNDEDVADVFQETMIDAFKSIKKLKYIEYFKTWIIKILINNCNSLYKGKKKNEIQFEELQEERCGASDEKLDNNLNFNCLIKKLDYDEQLALTLYYGEGYTNQEISEILKTNVNTIKTRIARAKNKIRKMEEVRNG